MGYKFNRSEDLLVHFESQIAAMFSRSAFCVLGIVRLIAIIIGG